MKLVLFLSILLLGSHVVVAQEYPEKLQIRQAVVAKSVNEQKAVQTIEASNQISSTAKAVYAAGQSVILQPGFVAQAGAVFSARIESVRSLASASDIPALSVRAYPNPFQDQTTIEYFLPQSGPVCYRLLDMSGQTVQQGQAKDEQPVGLRQMQLDGERLPAGIYLYRLQTEQGTRTIRLIKQP